MSPVPTVETEQEVEAVEPETRADRVLELLCAVQGHEVVTVKVETLREIKVEIERLRAEVAELRAAVERHRDCNPDVPIVLALLRLPETEQEVEAAAIDAAREEPK